jgi:peroxiredoxin
MTDTLSHQLAQFRVGWHARVPEKSKVLMEAHIAHLGANGIADRAKQVGDLAPEVRLPDQHGQRFDVADLLVKGPVVITFYRGGWCPFCNLELKAYEALLPRIAAAGASLVAISPEKPDDTASTAEKNELTFPVLSDIGQSVGRAFGVVYAFTDEVRTVYEGFGLDIPAKNGSPDDWSLPLSATYVVGADGVILFADTRVDYRERTDPLEVLQALEHRAAAE